MFFNNGYLQIPAGIYFSGDFTISTWVKVHVYKDFARIIDFRDSIINEAVALIFYSTTGNLRLINKNSTIHLSPLPTINDVVAINEWTFITTTLNGTTAKIYINGVEKASNLQYIPNAVVRDSCYIGYSYINVIQMANVDYDDIRIYNRPLSADEILILMNQN